MGTDEEAVQCSAETKSVNRIKKKRKKLLWILKFKFDSELNMINKYIFIPGLYLH